MNRYEIEKNWEFIKHDLQKKWNKLTDIDLAEVHGNYELLLAKLEKRYRLSEKQVEKEIALLHFKLPEHKYDFERERKERNKEKKHTRSPHREKKEWHGKHRKAG